MLHTTRHSRLHTTNPGTGWVREIGATVLFLAFIFGAHICVSFLAAGQGL